MTSCTCASTPAQSDLFDLPLESAKPAICVTDPDAWLADFHGFAQPANPSQRFLGVVLRAPQSPGLTPRVWELSEPCGSGTGNEAHYLALLAALKLARTQGARKLFARGNSQLVVMQVNAQWAVKSSTLAPLCQLAREIAKTFEDGFTIEWIPFHANSQANALAQRAAAAEAGREEPRYYPRPRRIEPQ